MTTKKLQILGSLGTKVEVDTTLSELGKAADAKITGDAITNLSALVGETPVSEQIDAALVDIEAQLADLLYKEIVISSFTIDSIVAVSSGSTVNTKSPIELGSTVTSVSLNWQTNKTPETITLDGVLIDSSATSYIYNDLNLTNTKTYNLKVTDEKGEFQKSTDLIFCNRVCYGVAPMPETINSDFVMSLPTKNLTTSKVNSGVKYNAGVGQYLWYCVPARMGTCTFIDLESQLGAGLSLVETINVKNSSGYEENYYVYRSDYAGLGSLTIKVF